MAKGGANLKDISGQTFDRLRVMSRFGSKRRQATWLCKCSCGTEVVALGTDLRSGRTTSCGCKKVERCKAGINTTHGHAKRRNVSVEYTAWWSLKQRCGELPSEWETFEKFLADVGLKPHKDCVLTRRDHTKPHGQGNTYWRDNADSTDKWSSEESVLDLRSLALAEAAARAGEAAA